MVDAVMNPLMLSLVLAYMEVGGVVVPLVYVDVVDDLGRCQAPAYLELDHSPVDELLGVLEAQVAVLVCIC